MPVKPRDVTPIISQLRNWCGQRKLISVHRFEEYVSPRSPPPARLPPGISHSLHNNLYLKRDGRRSAELPVIAYSSTKLLQNESLKTDAASKKVPKPGPGYDWNTGLPAYK